MSTAATGDGLTKAQRRVLIGLVDGSREPELTRLMGAQLHGCGLIRVVETRALTLWEITQKGMEILSKRLDDISRQ